MLFRQVLIEFFQVQFEKANECREGSIVAGRRCVNVAKVACVTQPTLKVRLYHPEESRMGEVTPRGDLRGRGNQDMWSSLVGPERSTLIWRILLLQLCCEQYTNIALNSTCRSCRIVSICFVFGSCG